MKSPPGYFEASRAEQVFTEFKELALKYWQARPTETQYDIERSKPVRAESPESAALRERIMLLFSEAASHARALRVDIYGTSYPPPGVGGPVIPVNFLVSVIDQHMGHTHVTEQEILDVINRCLGAARGAERAALVRRLVPLYWIIDLPALIVQIPFLILRAAGLPPSIEEHFAAQMIKVVLTIALLAALSYLGLEKAIPHAASLLGGK